MKLKDPKKNVLPQLDLEVENTNPIVNGIELNDDDDTIFYFSNNSNEDWSTQWNKKIYTFPAQRRTRMAIHGESPENVENIRKMFAVRYAKEQYAKTKEFEKRNTPIENKSPIPYNVTVLQPYIDSCLKPLPKGKIDVKAAEVVELPIQGDTRPLGDTSAPYDVFKDTPVKTYGEMPSN